MIDVQLIPPPERVIVVQATYNDTTVESTVPTTPVRQIDVRATFPTIVPQGNFTLENLNTAGIRDIVTLSREEYLQIEPLPNTLYLIT